MTELIDQLQGTVPEWFTDVHWVQLAKEHHDACVQIDLLSPEYPRLEAKYRAGLGVSATNNLWVWFITKPQSDEKDDGLRATYDIDATMNDDYPGVQDLRTMRTLHPDLYTDVQALCDEHSARYRSVLDTLNSKQTPSEEDIIKATISRFKMQARIEKILNLMREMGVSEATIGLLGK